ncbi:hypothetical protein BDN67DRAFT_963546 [Paxillus ammoniavirescens]|nr:hypothetical protein BDN67DRAFT_963546 [Paxillus ammoniavirescens]
MKLGVGSRPSNWAPAVPAPHIPTPHVSQKLPHEAGSLTQHPHVGHLMPVITPRAEPTSQASGVVIELSTLVTIPNFSRFYPGIPAESFQPFYYALDDGSLVAPPLVDDFRLNGIVLVITGCLLTVFLRNIWEAATYIWRGKVKKKGLLYAVLVSQLFGPVAFIPTITAQFSRSASCAVTMRITVMAAGVSLSFLVTGILGVKAYKCLDSNRFILAALVALRTAGSMVLVLDLVHLETTRSLSGRCYTLSSGLTSAFVILLLAESLFICLCFLYAVWSSYGSAAVRGRISIRLSLDEVNHEQPFEPRKEGTDSAHRRRGWWDYVPPLDAPNPFSSPRSRQPSLLSQERSFVTVRRDRSRRIRNGDAEGSIAVQLPRIPASIPSTEFTHFPGAVPWPPVATMSSTVEASHAPRREPMPFRRPASPASSSTSRLTRYMPMMTIFREVMRDELCYTATITAFNVVSAAMTLVGVNSVGGINSAVWIAFDWALISLVVLHSFGRMIRRHENESLIHQLSAWYHNVYTDRSTTELLRDGGPRRSHTPGISPEAPTRRSVTNSHCDTDVDESLSDMSARYQFTGSAYSSRGNLHYMAASTNGTSNILSPLQTVGSMSRIREGYISTPPQSDGDHTVCTAREADPSLLLLVEGSSCSQVSTSHWYNSSLPSTPVITEPSDKEPSLHASSYVS